MMSDDESVMMSDGEWPWPAAVAAAVPPHELSERGVRRVEAAVVDEVVADRPGRLLLDLLLPLAPLLRRLQ